MRTAGEPEVDDVSVNEAATGITETLALFADLGRDSFDDDGATVLATVHYERDYDNAFWDGTQLVFGDGDGTVFGGSPSRSTCSATSSPTRSPSTPPT